MEEWRENTGFTCIFFKRLRGREMNITMGVFFPRNFDIQRIKKRGQEGKLESRKGIPFKDRNHHTMSESCGDDLRYIRGAGEVTIVCSSSPRGNNSPSIISTLCHVTHQSLF